MNYVLLWVKFCSSAKHPKTLLKSCNKTRSSSTSTTVQRPWGLELRGEVSERVEKQAKTRGIEYSSRFEGQVLYFFWQPLLLSLPAVLLFQGCALGSEIARSEFFIAGPVYCCCFIFRKMAASLISSIFLITEPPWSIFLEFFSSSILTLFSDQFLRNRL